MEKFSEAMTTWTDQFVANMKQARSKSEPEHDRRVLICGYNQEEDCVYVATKVVESEYNLDDAILDLEEEETKPCVGDSDITSEEDEDPMVTEISDFNGSLKKTEVPSPPHHPICDPVTRNKVKSHSKIGFLSHGSSDNTARGTFNANQKEHNIADKAFDKNPERNRDTVCLNPKPPDVYDSLDDLINYRINAPAQLKTEGSVTGEILVYPVSPLKTSGKDAPSIELQQSVSKQMNAVVVHYNYFHKVKHSVLEFSGNVHGRKDQGYVLKLGFESYLYVCNALIHMYSSCHDLRSAQDTFDKMANMNLVCWNSLNCGFSQCNRFKEVLHIFKAMQVTNVKVDVVIMVKVILACSHLGDEDIAESIVNHIEGNHIQIVVYLGSTLRDMYGRFGTAKLAREVFDLMAERNIVPWNAMITAYVKVGNLVVARKLFEEMPKRDVTSWISTITSHFQTNQFSDALGFFQEMMVAKVKLDEITVAFVISTCAHLGRLNIGKAVHDYIHKYNVKVDIYIWNSLIDMYCKCGSIGKASEVFQGIKEKDSVSWTSVISGLARNGTARYARELVSEMIVERFVPTHGTFVWVLLACVHAGWVDDGLDYYENMEKVYGLVPEIKDYGCVVDLLSRSDHLKRTYDFIKRMPFESFSLLVVNLKPSIIQA